MANLSKQKRDQMIAYLEKLKEEHIDDESIAMFNEIENALTEKRFGLVFEEHSEKVDEMLLENVPVFTSDPDRRIEKDNTMPWNFIIEGDNLQALYLLRKTHKGKVDCIYIDPPYNTGARDWKYNNDYVDKNDQYRHSKWLSMMNQRLKIAKELLSENGALICAIDENEVNTVGLLLQDIFQEYLISCISVIHNPGGIQGANFSYCHEYAYFVFPNRSHYITKEKRNDNGDLTPFRDWGKENSKRKGSPNCFYPIYVDILENKVVGTGTVPDDSFHPTSANEINDNILTVWPIDNNGIERRWRFAYDTVHEILDELVPVSIKGVVNIQRNKQWFVRKTVWSDPSYFANNSGSQLIASMIGNRFSFPKSLYLTRECLRAVEQNKDAIIVDFFAGSGTTLHAVNLLNAEDGGHRRCVLVTNNEVSNEEAKAMLSKGIKPGDEQWEQYGIARYVTWPRTVCSINGVNIDGEPLKGNYIGTDIPMSRGLPANVKYFKCEWIPRIPDDDNLSDLLLEHVREMIELEHAIELDGKNYIMVLSEEEADDLEKNWTDYSLLKGIYISRNVLLTTKQNELFSTKEIHTIPDYYFDIEMKEVGASW